MRSQYREQKDTKSTPEMIGLCPKRLTEVEDRTSEPRADRRSGLDKLREATTRPLPAIPVVINNIETESDHESDRGDVSKTEPDGQVHGHFYMSMRKRDKTEELSERLAALEFQLSEMKLQQNADREEIRTSALMQANAITAINQVCLQADRTTPDFRYEDWRTDGDQDHSPEWNSRITHVPTTIVGIGAGRSKKESRLKAAKIVLSMLNVVGRYRKEIEKVGWIRDLTCEGVEPNPGPRVADSVWVTHPSAGPPTNFSLPAHPSGVLTITGTSAGADPRVIEVFLTGGPLTGSMKYAYRTGFTVSNILVEAGDLEGSVTTLEGTGDVYLAFTVVEEATTPQTVQITSSQIPLWTTEYPTEGTSVAYAAPPTPLILSGDVELNPGPIALEPQIEVFTYYQGEDSDTEGIKYDEEYVQSVDDRQHEEAVQIEHEKHVLASQLRDSIAKLASHSSHVGNYFHTMCYYYSVPVENRFDALTIEVTPPPEPEDPIEVIKRGRRVPPTTDKAERTSPRQKDAKTVPQPTFEEKKRQYQNVCSRIVHNFEAHPHVIVHWLERHEPKRSFVEHLAGKMLGKGWVDNNKWTQVHLTFYAYINNLNNITVAAKLAEFHEKYETFGELFKNLRADLEACKLHNKVMHAYNGNPLTRTFTEIEAAKEWVSFAKDTSSGLPLLTGYELQATITNIVGDANVNQSLVFRQDKLRGNIVKSDNSIVKNAATPLPSTSLIPRQLIDYIGDGEDDPATLSNATTNLRVSEVNIAQYYVNKIMPTDLSETVSDAVKNNTSSNWRRDNSSLAGFSNFDIASVNTTLIPKGLSLESMLLKLDMLHSIVSATASPRGIPSTARSLLDPWAVPVLEQMTLGMNDSPIVGETCGGNDPVFPWGGEKGTVSFHLTLQSVPAVHRPDAIFMPSGLLQTSEDAQESIALFVMSWAEWPFGLYTLTAGVNTSKDDRVIHPVKYVPQQTVTRVPGFTDLHIILPRRWGEANPTSLAGARAQAVVVPNTGPTGTVNIAANFARPINYVGGPLLSTSLADYLYTWATKFDSTTIKQYLGRLGAMIGVKDTLHTVHDINVALTQVFPKMTLSDGRAVNTWRGLEQDGNIEPADWTTRAALDYCYSSHMQISETMEPFPIQGQTSADYRCFSTDPSTWNKVVLGLATADNLKSERQTEVPAWYGHPSNVFWEMLMVVPQAIAWAHFFNSYGLSSSVWNTAYTGSVSRWAQNVARDTFCTSQLNGTITPAQLGMIVRSFFKAVMNRDVSSAMTSVEDTLVEMSVFDRWLPGNKYATVYTEAGVELDGLVPVLIPDVWIQYMAQHTPKYASSFPPPGGEDSLAGFGGEIQGFDVHRVVEPGRTGPYAYAPVAMFKADDGPILTDEEMFNNRIWFTEPRCTFGNTAGQPFAAGFPQSGFYPAGKNITLLANEVYPPEFCNASTLCIPYMNDQALRIVLYLEEDDSVIPQAACNKARRLARSAWLLGKVFISPKILNLSSKRDWRFEHTASRVSGFHETAIQNTIPARVELVRMQAVEPAALPSAVSPLLPLTQPSEIQN